MEENSPSKPEEKPFSVLERFRQLKKEKEQSPVVAPVESINTPEKSGTVFQATKSLHNTGNGDFSRTDGSRSNRGHGSRLFGKRPFNQTHHKRAPTDLHEGQKEIDVGITEFIRQGPGFKVILKHRYTDFHVNEIDLDGNVVRLTSTEVPIEEVKSEPLCTEEDPSIIPAEKWAELRNIVENELDTFVNIDVTDIDKTKRTRMHKAVKRRFGVLVFSNTVDDKERKILRIGFASLKREKSDMRYSSWPKDKPEYLHFVLVKEHTEMNEAVAALAKYTLIRANKFGFAGTKDKRAVTTQQVCVRRVSVNKFNKCVFRGFAIGDFSYKHKNLRLGDLKGNKFKLALRNLKVANEVVQEAIEGLKKKGFINYFGMQRFGQSALVPTYVVGKAILNGNWELATELILKPRPGESTYFDVKEAREVWWKTKDPSKALKALSRKERSIEGRLLLGLKKHGPKAYHNAFDDLPLHSVNMYLHSYQSLIWNKVVSRRIKQFGLKVLAGDLVRVVDSDPVEAEVEEADSSDEEEGTAQEESLVEFGYRHNVRTLTAKEAETASIYDVIYPVPGNDIKFPDNEVAKWYKEFLEEDGHSLECFNKVKKKYGMYGCYRSLLERVDELSWEIVHYSDPDDDLLLSDLDVLRGKPPLKLYPEGPYKALVLEFNLKVCCYATMAIRELTKCETSTSSQAMLTNEAKEEDRAAKRQKLDKESGQVTESELDKTSTSIAEDTGCEMETVSVSVDSVELPQNNNTDATDEEGDMNKREAEADNIINKYLEINFH